MWGQRQNLAFWDTSVGQKILTLDFIFRKISEAQRSFIEAAARHDIHIACPSDCGSCCHGFMPDVLPVEADYIAYYILRTNSGTSSKPGVIPEVPAALPTLETWLSQKQPDNPSPCPFHDPFSPGANCRVYLARPLICRLFGYSSSRAKTGQTIFRLCRHMPTPEGFSARTLDTKELNAAIGATPPLMSDFAMEILAIDPSSASERTQLSEAMPSAFARVSSMLRYCPDEPEPHAAA